MHVVMGKPDFGKLDDCDNCGAENAPLTPCLGSDDPRVPSPTEAHYHFLCAACRDLLRAQAN